MNDKIILIINKNISDIDILKIINDAKVFYNKVIAKIVNDEFEDLKNTENHISLEIIEKIKRLKNNTKDVLFNIEITNKNIDIYSSAIDCDFFIDFYVFNDELLNIKSVNGLLEKNRVDFNFIDCKTNKKQIISNINNSFKNVNIDFYETEYIKEEKIDIDMSDFNLNYFMNESNLSILLKHNDNKFELILPSNNRYHKTNIVFDNIKSANDIKKKTFLYISKNFLED